MMGAGALQRGCGRQALPVFFAEAQVGVAAKEEGEGARSWSQDTSSGKEARLIKAVYITSHQAAGVHDLACTASDAYWAASCSPSCLRW